MEIPMHPDDYRAPPAPDARLWWEEQGKLRLRDRNALWWAGVAIPNVIVYVVFPLGFIAAIVAVFL
jgi:hypothetical protein